MSAFNQLDFSKLKGTDFSKKTDAELFESKEVLDKLFAEFVGDLNQKRPVEEQPRADLVLKEHLRLELEMKKRGLINE